MMRDEPRTALNLKGPTYTEILAKLHNRWLHVQRSVLIADYAAEQQGPIGQPLKAHVRPSKESHDREVSTTQRGTNNPCNACL